jgi:hypothetical protein
MPEHKENPMIKVVFIDSKGRAVTHVTHVKRAVDEVMWIDQSNAGPWWITFDKPNSLENPDPDYVAGSPFGGVAFQVPTNGNVKSGMAPGGVTLGTYKYNVRRVGPGGPITNDPDIDIEG